MASLPQTIGQCLGDLISPSPMPRFIFYLFDQNDQQLAIIVLVSVQYFGLDLVSVCELPATVICDGEGNDAVLRMMQERADSLDRSINLYAEVLGELARPRE